VVVIYRSLSQSKVAEWVAPTRTTERMELKWSTASGERTPGGEFAGPYGYCRPGRFVCACGPAATSRKRRLRRDFSRALGTLAVQQRQYAQSNPADHEDRPMTWDDYHNARMINWPLRMF